MMIVSFTESLAEVMSSLLLSSTSFQEQCRAIGYGILLSDYMQCTRYFYFFSLSENRYYYIFTIYLQYFE